MKKRLLSMGLIFTLSASLLFGCGSKEGSAKKTGETLTILNYGKYYDEDALKAFEDETGITIKYEEYESPEEMYTKYKAGSIDYDLICSSEYMVEKLILEGEVLEADFTTLENYDNIDPTIIDMTRSYDPDNKYNLPYFYGTLGLLYNKEEVSQEEVSSWDCLWDDAYTDEIIMENSVRDTFVPALIANGFSINETSEDNLRTALALLETQSEFVYGYFVDETGDEMIAENAKIALVYSGEAAYAMDYNENLSYSVPKEGSNMWIDSWFIPKTCQNTEAAMKFLDFTCRDDIAQANFEYVYYVSPIISVCEAQDEETKKNEAINPSKETLQNCELFTALDDETTSLYNTLWQELKSN